MENSQMPEVTNAQILQVMTDLIGNSEKKILEVVDTKNKEIMTVVLGIAGNVSVLQADVAELKTDVAELKTKMGNLEEKVDGLDKKIDENYDEMMLTLQNQSVHMEEEFSRVRNEMASKDHLDRKVDGLEVSIGGSLRQVDKKDSALVTNLLQKKIISSQESENLIVMSPFPVHA